MSISSADINAAPREITIAGKTYRATPLKRRELAEFVAWVQDTEFDAAKRQTSGMTPDEAQRFREHAWNKVAGYQMAHPNVLGRLCTPEGAARALWLSLRHEHPDITEDAVYDLMNDPDALAEGMEAIDRMTGGGTPLTGGGAPVKKKRAPKKRKSQSR